MAMGNSVADNSYGYPLIAIAIAVCIASYLAAAYFTNRLNRYPGPVLAKFTNLWHYYDVKSNRHHDHLIALHRRHGDVVRIGPNRLSIANPEYVGRVYGTQDAYPKSEMYESFCLRNNGRRVPITLAQRDQTIHAYKRKAVAYAFTLTAIRDYEPYMDEIIKLFVNKLKARVEKPSSFVCDFGLWTRFYVTDTILYLTFGSTFGFLDAGKDSAEFFDRMNANMDKDSLYIPMPWWSLVTKFNPVVALFSSENSFVPGWCMNQIRRRQQERARLEEETGHAIHVKSDFLDKFMDAAKISGAPGIDYVSLMDWCLTNVQAGSETITVELVSTMYHLLKCPEKLTRLLEEIRSAWLSNPVTYKEAQKLAYLDACLKEGMRLHPAVGLGMERTVTGRGLKLPDGSVASRGVLVSMNAWVVARQSLFGDAPDEFIPERWFRTKGETEAAYAERMNAWKRADLVFSHGVHSCSGKHVALMEMYKVLPTLLLNFDIKLQDQDEDWDVINRFLVRQTGFICVLRLRS